SIARLVGLAVALLAGGGCPRFTNDGLLCGPGDACPPGYHCASNKRCWKLGQDPGDGGGGGGGAGAGGSDLAGVMLLDNSQPCSGDNECSSGNCVDNVCC